MIRKNVLLVALAAFSFSPAAAQAPAANNGGGNPAPIVSPEVRPDRTVTLRFRAPDADEVVLIGELDGQQHPMTKGEDGVWTVTIGPLAPDVYNYQFRVDGVIAMDPLNPWVKLGFGNFPPANLVSVPSDGLQFDDAKDVPHGTVRLETYHSEAIGAPRTLWVYTPPGYEESNQRYPVFYLLHGSGNIDSSWILTGRANYIMDNLIAEGASLPMILVMPFGYARQGVGAGPARQGDLETLLRRAGGQSADLFAADVLGDVIPFVENKYRVIADADHRAIGGLSMGGGQSIAIGFRNTDVFHSIVVMSAGAQNAQTTYPEFFADPAAINQKMKFIWLGIGKDDFLLESAEALHGALEAAGIDHDYQLGEGRHEWVVWRHHLREVAPQLFRW
jgi:enterochelin esterase-like enzyme